MSAVTWESVPATIPATPSRPRVRHLASVPAPADRPLGPVRLTRAGRLAIALAIALVAAVLIGWSLVGPPSSSPTAGAVLTVQSGQTLSGIVAAELPGMDAAVAMAQVRELNHLSTSELQAGQVLVLPQR